MCHNLSSRDILRNARHIVFQNSEKREIDTTEDLATKLGVSTDTASRIIKIHKKAPEELKEKLRKGDATVNQVYVAIRREEIKQAVKEAKWPEGKYRVIYADPPWQYDFAETDSRAIENQYSSMPLNQIKRLRKYIPAAENAVLFLWAPAPKLRGAAGGVGAEETRS